MDINEIKKGDILYCVRGYVDTEIVPSLIKYVAADIKLGKYAEDDIKLVHLTVGKHYEVIDVDLFDLPVCRPSSIKVCNDFGIKFWYDISHFGDIREIRRKKLYKINNLNL